MNEETLFFRGNTQERLVIAVASPLLAVLSVGGLIATRAWFDQSSASDRRSRLFDHIFLTVFSEIFIAFFLFLSVAFIWALFRPAWTIRILLYARDHAWQAMLLFLGGFALTFLLV